jgi:hypothetical protein
MRAEDGDRAKVPRPKRHEHRQEQGIWPATARTKSPPPSWNNKTMHLPATRIGEIKHGKT